MDLERLPPQLRSLLEALAGALHSREPAIRRRVEELREANPGLTSDELARKLIASTRFRVAASGAASGATAVLPGLGTLLALGTVTSQAFFALEQEAELVMAIAMLYGHELAGSDERVLEALVVVGIAGGAVKLREEFLVVGGQKMAIAAFRKLPQSFAAHSGGRMLATILGRVVGARGAAAIARFAPLAVGMVAGAGFDWIAVTALGRAAIRYYGPGGPASRWPALPPPPARALPAPGRRAGAKDIEDVESGG